MPRTPTKNSPNQESAGTAVADATAPRYPHPLDGVDVPLPPEPNLAALQASVSPADRCAALLNPPGRRHPLDGHNVRALADPDFQPPAEVQSAPPLPQVSWLRSDEAKERVRVREHREACARLISAKAHAMQAARVERLLISSFNGEISQDETDELSSLISRVVGPDLQQQRAMTARLSAVARDLAEARSAADLQNDRCRLTTINEKIAAIEHERDQALLQYNKKIAQLKTEDHQLLRSRILLMESARLRLQRRMDPNSIAPWLHEIMAALTAEWNARLGVALNGMRSELVGMDQIIEKAGNTTWVENYVARNAGRLEIEHQGHGFDRPWWNTHVEKVKAERAALAMQMLPLEEHEKVFIAEREQWARFYELMVPEK